MSDLERLFKEIFHAEDKLTPALKEKILTHQVELVLGWNSDGSLHDWGTLE